MPTVFNADFIHALKFARKGGICKRMPSGCTALIGRQSVFLSTKRSSQEVSLLSIQSSVVEPPNAVATEIESRTTNRRLVRSELRNSFIVNLNQALNHALSKSKLAGGDAVVADGSELSDTGLESTDRKPNNTNSK
jgi:hypothetical protein